MRMNWIKRAFTATVLLVVASGSSAFAGAAEAGNPVGFQLVQMPDGAGGKFPAAVWYPTTAAPSNVSLPGQMPMQVALAELHSVAGARHLSFLAPCPGGPPVLCADAGGFDRKAFHASMNTSVIDFFNRWLAAPRAQGG
jgi:hypothetical protein